MDEQCTWVDMLPFCAILIGALLLLARLVRMRLRSRR